MPQQRLSDLTCRKAAPAAKAYKLSDGGGLALWVSTTGAKSWRYSFKQFGKWGLYTIGRYPDVTLAEAREAHRAARATVKAGQQPTMTRKQETIRKANETANTFGAVAREWLARNAERWSDSYREQLAARFENDILPRLGERPIRDVTAADLLGLLETLKRRGPHAARLARQWISAVFEYGARTLRADHNPAAPLKGTVPAPRTRHYATLTRNELGALLREIDGYRGQRQTAILLRLLALLFPRPSELREARWEEIDFEHALWRIPAERMKGRTPHVVPLPEQAMALLRELDGLTGRREFLFPHRSDPRKVMGNATVNCALYDLGYAGRLSAHGFRGTASTILNEMGYRPDVIEKQLAHREPNAVRASYNHADYLEERRRMMQRWADLLGQLERQQADKVVPIRA